MKRVYSPKVIQKIQQHFSDREEFYDKQFYEELEQSLPYWKYNQGRNPNIKTVEENLKQSVNNLIRKLFHSIYNLFSHKER
jgi:hypothetical protein